MSDSEPIMQAIDACVSEEYPLEALSELDLELGSDAIEPLLALLDDEDLRHVLGALLLLPRIERADAIVPRLVPYLEDPHPVIAEQVRWTLRELGAPALPLLMDAYASHPAHKLAVADALGWLGPRAADAAKVLVEDARTDAGIAEALRAIRGPWPEAPEKPMPYLGETIRLDGYGPPPRARHGIEIWIHEVDARALHTEVHPWDRGVHREDAHPSWRPDQISIAAPSIVVAAWHSEDDAMATTTLHADDGARFTNEELLWKILDAHHRIAPCNDRVFEGLRRWDDGSYYISTGS